MRKIGMEPASHSTSTSSIRRGRPVSREYGQDAGIDAAEILVARLYRHQLDDHRHGRGVYGNYYLEARHRRAAGWANLPDDAIYPMNLADSTKCRSDGQPLHDPFP